MKTYANVILPLPISHLYVYEVTKSQIKNLKVGMRVIVQFGKTKFYTALVENIHHTIPDYKTKEIINILDEIPIIDHNQVKLWKWIATYYICHLGEVFNTALPSALKLQSETQILKNEDQNIDSLTLSENEHLIYESLDIKESLSVQEVSKIVDKRNIFPLLKTLVNKGIIITEENLYQKYKPKLEEYVRLHPSIKNNKPLFKEKLEQLSCCPKQRELFLQFMGIYANYKKLKVKDLLRNTQKSKAVLKGLTNKSLIEIYDIQTDRIQTSHHKTLKPKNLNENQQKALEQIQNAFEKNKPVLLHGVTSSGKTEIYINLIQQALEKGQQSLYLLPEIALTTQIISRLSQHFGDQIGVYHSKYNDNEKVEIWNHIASGKYKVILGTRSAIFLPFTHLKLIIIDEEHETSFKQQDPAPRYHGRDTAMVLGKIHNAHILLGSATPSLESYYNTQKGKYKLVELTHRFGNMQMPHIELIDIKTQTIQKTIQGHFSTQMITEIKDTLYQKKQVILFQNRRGFAPVMQCYTCANVWECKHCDVKLTYHKYTHTMRCHYCGFSIDQPSKCSACGSYELYTKGLGTQQIEQELKKLFPKATTQRMDLDTTSKKNAYQNIIDDFENKKIDIIVGTQMITKGLDFENVSLVGILNADNMLNLPDFRAFEKAFQLMTQVAGRAGRKHQRGKVLIQSFDPLHTILQQVSNANYHAMYTQQLYERKQYCYPPFYKIIKISLKHKDKNHLNIGSNLLSEQLKSIFNTYVLGPEFNPIPRIKNKYIKNIMIKIPYDKSLLQTKNTISHILNNFLTSDYKNIRISINVDDN